MSAEKSRAKKNLKRKLMIHVRPPRPQRSHYSSVRSFGILLWPETGNGTSTPLAVKKNKKKGEGAVWKEQLYNISRCICTFNRDVKLLLNVAFFSKKRMCLDIIPTCQLDAINLKCHLKPPKIDHREGHQKSVQLL